MRTFTFEGLNLDFFPGSTTVIKGDNGAGKTSFFNIFTGTLSPTTGSVFVSGLNLNQVDPQFWRSQLVAVPQEPEF